MSGLEGGIEKPADRKAARRSISTLPTEDGLEQEFNSLDAQREAAVTYIANRRHLGWQAISDAYDDGGFTGGNMERPALQRLLQDIKNRKLDCVIVYKLDRITRSLIDFARLMMLFEEYGVAFVSVTQEFDSSTPVGRLTLNILSSFSQFEREIIRERTRDKMVASRKKGIFVGGFPPFGYDIDVRSHKLVVNSQEADIVRDLFATFLELKSVTAVMHALNAKDYRTKTFVSRRGRVYEGHPWSKGAVRKVLMNPLYIGQSSDFGDEWWHVPWRRRRPSRTRCSSPEQYTEYDEIEEYKRREVVWR